VQFLDAHFQQRGAAPVFNCPVFPGKKERLQ
jgi:hypothetical protein